MSKKFLLNLMTYSFIIWVGTIVYFTLLVITHQDVDTWSQKDTNLLIIDIIIGLASFPLVLLRAIMFLSDWIKKNKIHKEITPNIHKTNSINPWFVFSMVLLVFLAYLYGRSNNSEFLGLKTNIILSPTPQPTITSIITAKPSPTTVMNTSIQTTDPDPPVLCQIHANCGGGTTPLKQSECNNSTCCQINGKWVFYKERSLCFNDQQKAFNYKLPTSFPIPTNKSDIVSCSIYYAVTNTTRIYQLSKSDCEYYRNDALQLNNRYYQSINNSTNNNSYQGTNYYDSDSLLQDAKNLGDAMIRCKKEFEEKKQGIMSLYGNQTGTADFMIKQLQEEYSICL